MSPFALVVGPEVDADARAPAGVPAASCSSLPLAIVEGMSSAPARDHVDYVIDQWRAQRPDLDHTVWALTSRLARSGRHLERAVDKLVRPLGLAACEYPVLAALRRAGEPYRRTPTELARTMMLSSGAVTNRVDRLERAGMVRRIPDPHDRRGVLVELTPQGLEIVDRAIEAQIEAEPEWLAALDASERAELDRLLHKLLVSFEDERGAESSFSQSRAA